ncbi:17742_t:CDS:2, partial [Entrophospora sp. SA101]
WQDLVVEAIKQNYDEESNSFDDGKIRANLGEKGILKNKKTMPFVQDFKKRVEKFGKEAFNRALLFNEYDTLVIAKGFIQRSLGYVQSEIVNAEEVSEEEKRLTEFAMKSIVQEKINRKDIQNELITQLEKTQHHLNQEYGNELIIDDL